MNNNELMKIKKIEIEMLNEFILICKKYNLRYFLLGGTALGAVRHQGFIPWDDDIDVGMPRIDYEQFLKIAQIELPWNIFLQTNFTDNEYPMNFAKLRNDNTTFIETSLKNIRIHHGVYIDIFPLDGYPKSKIAQLLRNMKDWIFKYRINDVYYLDPFKDYRHPIKKYVSAIFKKCLKRLYKEYKEVTIKRDLLLKKYQYDLNGIVANYSGAWGKREIMPKEYFGDGTMGFFEGLEVILPQKYHEYLTSLYGDYMTPPPLDKQIPHHYYTVLDFSKSYRYYLSDNMK